MDKQEQEHKEKKQEQEHKEEQQEQEPKEEQEQEQEQPNEHEQEKELGKEHELQHTNPSPDPPIKQNSPPHEPERRQTYPNSPPKQYSPPRLPYHNSRPKSPPLGEDEEEEEDHRKPPFKLPPPPAVAAAVAVETKVEPTSLEVQDEENGVGGDDGHGHGHGDGFVNTGSGRKHLKTNLSILKKARRESMMKRALVVSRISGFVFSLVSFSVLAADRDRGWAIDSFYRYKEFRYCMAVNVIAFVYSGFQGYDLIYQLTSGERKVRQPLRHYLDFSLDQVITYLLMSASSSAAVRVDDWQSNWGKDPFPDMARASVALSFLAFVALALSSLISGYKVYTLKSL